jgi:hypothetical protein
MRNAIFLGLVGLACCAFGLRAVALCGPDVALGKTCGPIWSTFCPTEGCQQVSGSCPNSDPYNAVLQGPQKYLGFCLALEPPDPGAECTEQCYACSDQKYFIPNGALWSCKAEYLKCGVTVEDTVPRCQ